MTKQTEQSIPRVNDGCTLHFMSDCSPGTIVKVSPSGKTIEFTRDEIMRTDSNGMSEEQHYVFLPQPDGPRQTARFSQKLGKFKTKGGQIVGVGYRRKNYDFSF